MWCSTCMLFAEHVACRHWFSFSDSCFVNFSTICAQTFGVLQKIWTNGLPHAFLWNHWKTWETGADLQGEHNVQWVPGPQAAWRPRHPEDEHFEAHLGKTLVHVEECDEISHDFQYACCKVMGHVLHIINCKQLQLYNLIQVVCDLDISICWLVESSDKSCMLAVCLILVMNLLHVTCVQISMCLMITWLKQQLQKHTSKQTNKHNLIERHMHDWGCLVVVPAVLQGWKPHVLCA